MPRPGAAPLRMGVKVHSHQAPTEKHRTMDADLDEVADLRGTVAALEKRL